MTFIATGSYIEKCHPEVAKAPGFARHQPAKSLFMRL